MTSTRGRQRLSEILDPKTGHTQAWLASLLGVDQSTVSDWCRGVCRPGDHLRAALFPILGIPPEDWQTAAERRQVTTALRRAESAPAPPGSHKRLVGAKPRAAKRGAATGGK